MNLPRDTVRPAAIPARLLFDRAGVAGLASGVRAEGVVSSVTDDSRRVGSGAVFVAVRGARADGHGFLQQAIRAGAGLVVVDQRTGGVPGGATVVRVADTRAALARLTAAWHGLMGEGARCPQCPRLIGVTGTNGKTTVCYLLRSILRATGARVGMLGTVEYDLVGRTRPASLTTPAPGELAACIAEARDAGASWVVMEVSSHALDQRRTGGLRFAAAVYTNLSGDHLDYHDTMDAYLARKRRLFEGLDAGAVAVVNGEDERGGEVAAAARRAGATVRTYGMGSGADVGCGGLVLSGAASRFNLRGTSFETAIGCRLIGRFNVMNVLAASAAAEALGVAPDAIRRGIEGLDGVPGRLERVTEDHHAFRVFVDYAHTDAALEHVLDALRPLTAGRLICVFGCGGDRDRSKRPRMGRVVGAGADVAIVTSDNPRTEDPDRIIADVLGGFDGSCSRAPIVEPDRAQAIRAAIAQARAGDTVLIAGKGHEATQIVGTRRLTFDDRVEARRTLARMGTDDRRIDGTVRNDGTVRIDGTVRNDGTVRIDGTARIDGIDRNVGTVRGGTVRIDRIDATARNGGTDGGGGCVDGSASSGADVPARMAR